jgi:tetratricopeptide (TPR) repeat protein
MGFYALATLLVLFATVLTQSRGPMMGLLGGLFFFLLVWASVEGKGTWVWAIVVLALLGGGLLVTVNLPQTPLAAIKTWPYVGRLTRLRGDPSLQGRAVMWKSALDMATAIPLRFLIGYGPESARVAFYPYITADFADLLGMRLTTGRFHNETMDALVGTGLVGLLAYLLLFGAAFAWALKKLHVIASPHETRRFAITLAAGALVGLPGSWLIVGGPRLVALTIPAGMLLSMAIYVVGAHLQERAHRPPSGPNRILVIALFAGLVAHFIEIQTGIAVTATRTQFWLYAGLLASIARGVEEDPALAGRASRRTGGGRRRSRRRGRRRSSAVDWPRLAPALAYGLGVGLLLITLAFDFFTAAFDFRPTNVAVMGLLVLIWLLGGVVTLLEAAQRTTREDEAAGGRGVEIALVYTAASLGALAVFLPFHIAATNAGGSVTAVVDVLYLFLFAGTLALALTLLKASPAESNTPSQRFWRPDRWWLYPILALIVVLLIWRGSLTIVKADILFAEAQALQAANRLDRSIDRYQQALELAPRQDHYYPFLGQAYLRKAVGEKRAVWFEKTEEIFEKARDLNPRRPDHYANLGLLYYHWGRMTPNPAHAAERLKMALSYYERATAMSPHTQGRLLETNRLETHRQLLEIYLVRGQVDQAIEQARAAVGLAPADEKAELEERIARLRASQVRYWADAAPDCRVDAADAQAVAGLWRCREGSRCYDPRFDRDEDGRITVVDITRVVAEWGWTCPEG